MFYFSYVPITRTDTISVYEWHYEQVTQLNIVPYRYRT